MPATLDPSLAVEADLLELAVAFTDRHRATSDWPKSTREVACRAVNFPRTLLPLMPEDLFVGRRVAAIADVVDQHYPESDSPDTFGYYFDKDRFRRVLQQSGQTEGPLAEELTRCAEYWRDRQSEDRVVAKMDAAMTQALPSQRFDVDSAVAHRLCRVASPGVDYTFLLEHGLPGVRRYFNDQLSELDKSDAQAVDFGEARIHMCDLLLECLEHYRAEVAEAIEVEVQVDRLSELQRLAEALMALTKRPPETFFEATQLLHLFTVVGFYCNCFGRLDDTLGTYLAHDLDAGRLDVEEATRLLENLWLLWGEQYDNTRITLGGVGRRDEHNADIFTRVALEATRRFFTNYRPRRPFREGVFMLSPQVALRVSKKTPDDILEQAMDVMAAGTTFPLMYNDEVNVSAVAKAFRIDHEDAKDYTAFDCGEYIIDKQSIGTPSCIINLPKALEVALHRGIDPVTGKRVGPDTAALEEMREFEDVWSAYAAQVSFAAEQSARFQRHAFDVLAEDASLVAMSMLQPESRRTSRGILDGGCAMLGGTYETYGNITAADALLSIRELVYEQELVSLTELRDALASDFDGYGWLLERAEAVPKFGNDNDRADAMAQRVHDHLCHVVRDQAEVVGLHHYLIVAINNSANVAVGRHVGASADGRRAGQPVSNGNTPTAGNDRQGITALLNSIVKLSPDYHAGAVHNLRFSKRTISEHRDQVMGLLEAYFDMGGTQYMLTITSRDELLDALDHPEKYGHLLVRVGGFSARFVDLPRDVQMEIINRNAY